MDRALKRKQLGLRETLPDNKAQATQTGKTEPRKKYQKATVCVSVSHKRIHFDDDSQSTKG